MRIQLKLNVAIGDNLKTFLFVDLRVVFGLWLAHQSFGKFFNCPFVGVQIVFIQMH